MKILKITLDKIRCFDYLEIDFCNSQGSKDWVMILGDNGVGKTTILRSLAFGLTEESGASGLLDELGSDWIRYGFNKGFIKIELEPFPGCEEKAFIETHFVKDKKLKDAKGLAQVDQRKEDCDSRSRLAMSGQRLGLNVLHIIRGLANSSGTTHIVGPLSEEQAKLGCEVEVWHVQKGNDLPVEPDEHYVTSRNFPLSLPMDNPGISLSLRRALFHSISNFDVVHIHSYFFLPEKGYGDLGANPKYPLCPQKLNGKLS